jgi:hypothetical protein
VQLYFYFYIYIYISITFIISDVLDLCTLGVRPIRSDEHDRWQRMMVEKHYWQSNGMVGEQIRYVAVSADGA